MKALVKKFPKPGLWFEDAPIPEITEEEVLIKTSKASICGTDVHIYKWDEWAQKTIKTPLVIGHEFMGIVAKVGRQVKGVKEGDRVSGEGHITCDQCPACKMGMKHLCTNTRGLGVHRHGCFAEYFALPAENIFLLPPSIPDEIASIFDPFGNAVHTALSFPLTGEDVLITGAGPIGVMAAAVANKAGASSIVITDRNDYRLALAKKMGATHTVNIGHQSLEEAIGSGFDVGFEMSGNPNALSDLLTYARHGAHIALLGIMPRECVVDWDKIIFKMLQIKGIYGREVFRTWYQMTHLLESGLDLRPIITHHFSANDYEKGFAAMESGNCGKVILNWDEMR